MDRLARQRRNVRARSWVDAEGMWNLAAKFDPVTGVRVAARIDAMVQAMFAETVPDECPTDPIEKQRYLAAHATARLLLDEALHDHTEPSGIDGEGEDSAEPQPSSPTRPRPGRPEFIAVIDADAPGHTGPVAEFSIGVEIPARVLAALAGDADTHAVVVRNGIVLYAPGELEPRPHHPTRQPRPTPSPPRPLQTLRHPRLQRRLRPLQTPPHHLVATRRPHRPRQPPARLQRPPRQHPPRRLAHRPRTQPRTHPAPPRRIDPHHRTTQPTNRRLTPTGARHNDNSRSGATTTVTPPTTGVRAGTAQPRVHRTQRCGV
jgi:hypothetical protein